ncbi:MAG: PilZ domain-containing protein [Acidobacteriota bacterium]
MGSYGSIFEFFLILVPILVILFTLSYYYDRRKKNQLKKKFKKFTSNYRVTREDARTVPRVIIPDSLETFLKFSEKEFYRMKGTIIDLSLSGLRVVFNNPVKKIPINQLFKNVRIVTPINSVRIGELKIVRIENIIKKGVMAFHIKDIEDNQFEELKKTMVYFERFSRNAN